MSIATIALGAGWCLAAACGGGSHNHCPRGCASRGLLQILGMVAAATSTGSISLPQTLLHLDPYHTQQHAHDDATSVPTAHSRLPRAMLRTEDDDFRLPSRL